MSSMPHLLAGLQMKAQMAEDEQASSSSYDEIVVVNSFTFVLALLYLSIVIVTSFQIMRIIWNRHRLLSYQFLFLALSWTWALGRSAFFLFSNDLNTATYLSLYWSPFILQFATFSLLVVFFASIVHKKSWKGRTRTVTGAIFIIVNLIFALLITVYIVLYLENDPADEPAWLSSAAQIIPATIFLVLILILGVYGTFVFKLMSNKDKNMIPFHLRGASNKTILVTTAVLVVIFTSRSLYDYVSAGVSSARIDIDFGWSADDAKMFCLFFFWEIIPAAIVLLLFWHIPSKGGSRKSSISVNDIAAPNYTHHDNSMLAPGKLFLDDMRYDSEEEDESVMVQVGSAHGYYHNPGPRTYNEKSILIKKAPPSLYGTPYMSPIGIPIYAPTVTNGFEPTPASSLPSTLERESQIDQFLS